MEIEEKKINGLRTCFVDYPGAKSCSLQFWFRAGSSLEEKSNLGIAHFLEHMFFKGTARRPGAKIAYDVESNGGDINAFTSFDYTCYYINSPQKKLKYSLDILLDMVSNPLFSEEDLIPERNVVLEEYKRSIDNAGHYHFHNIQRNSFSKGYSHPILGNPKTITSFTRKQLIEFRKKFYNQSNAALVIAGDMKKVNGLNTLISRYTLPKGPKTKYLNFKQTDKKEILFSHNKEVSQATLTMTIKAPEYNATEAAAEDIALNALCLGDSSILTQKLVKENPIATSVSASTLFFNKGGIHFLRCVYPKENNSKVLKELGKNLKEVIRTGFNEKDLNKIKNQYLASKIYEKESVDSYAFSFGHGFAQNENFLAEKDFINRIENVTLEEVNKAIFNIFEKNIKYHLQLPPKIKDTNFKKAINNFNKNLKKSLVPRKKNKREEVKTSKHDSQVKSYEISKGVEIIYRHNPTIETSVLHAYIRGGLCLENEQNCGTHYLLSKCLTYGHSGKDYKELKFELESKSASMSGFSGKNAYGLTLHCLSKDFEEISKDFFQTLFEPQFPSNYLKLEKEITLRNIEHLKIDPIKQCFKSFQKELFGKHYYSLDMLGNEKTLKKITSKKINEQHTKNLKNQQILFTYCGDMSLAQVKSKIHSYMNKLGNRKITKPKDIKISLKKDIYHHIQFTREQTQIFIGYPGLSMNAKENIYLRILTEYLSGQSSELFVDVRDRKGLCYATQAIQHSALEAGYWGIYIGTGAKKVNLAIDAIEKLLEKIKNKGFKKSELNQIKKMIEGNQALQLQSNDDYANHYSIPALHGKGLDFEFNKLEMIQKIKLEGLNKYLNKFLSQKKIIITSGPTSWSRK